MHVNQVIWHEENIATIWETSHRYYIMRKFIHEDVTAGGRLDFVWTLVQKAFSCKQVLQFDHCQTVLLLFIMHFKIS